MIDMRGWEGIEEFVAAASAGSFTAAAKALGVSSSHISRAIARLEDKLQAQVFMRNTRRVVLTDTGRGLAEHFRRLIEERDQAFAAAGEQGEPQGELRLTCSTTLGEHFIAPIVQRFAQAHPKLSVTIELTNRVIDLVAEGFDLAIRTGTLTDSRLISTRIGFRRLYVCAAPSYLNGAGIPAEIGDIGTHQCLIGTATTWRFKVNGEAREFRPRARWRCNSGTAVAHAAVAGMGICQLPGFYVLQSINAGHLLPLLEDFRADDEPIWAVYPERRHLLPKVRNLVVVLKSELGSSLNVLPRSISPTK